MRLEEINALRGLDRDELIAKGRELGLEIDEAGVGRSIRWPSTDSLRLAIIEKTIEGEGPFGIPRAAEIGRDHWAEAVKIHAHGVELLRASTSEPADHKDEEQRAALRQQALDHFEIARSAAAVAQVGISAAVLQVLGETMQELA